LDGMEESLHTSARIVVMWNSILKSEGMGVVTAGNEKGSGLGWLG
jgi:hypothetical protein